MKCRHAIESNLCTTKAAFRPYHLWLALPSVSPSLAVRNSVRCHGARGRGGSDCTDVFTLAGRLFMVQDA